MWSTTEFLKIFYAHDSHHVIKRNVDLSYQDAADMNLKNKGKWSHVLSFSENSEKEQFSGYLP